MKSRFRRNAHSIRCMLQMPYHDVSIPLFVLCMIPACTGGILLAVLTAWKAVFFPAAVPNLLWWIFLPVWLTVSCFIPAGIASCILSSRNHTLRSLHAHLCTACTAELLLAHLWTLTVLYRFPPLFCMIISISAALLSLFSLPASFRFCDGAGLLNGIYAVWNLYLTIMWIFM